MFEFSGKQYVINLDNLFSYVGKPSKQDRREQEITDGYDFGDNGMQQVSKIIREIKSKGDSTQENYRYDFIRILLAQILEIENVSDLDFGDEVSIATLIKYNILEEVI